MVIREIPFSSVGPTASDSMLKPRRENRPVPEGWVIDQAGQPVPDPKRYLEEPDNTGVLPLGGMQFGHKGYGLSVIPALWAFFFAFGDYALLTLAAGFLLILPIDIAATRAGLAPVWWTRLRVLLTSVVVPCLVIGHLAA